MEEITIGQKIYKFVTNPAIFSIILLCVPLVVSLGTTWCIRHLDFKNDYKKIIIKKRINAYSHIEKLINDLYRVYHRNSNIYHKVFEYENNMKKFSNNLINIMCEEKIWISADIHKNMFVLNNIIVWFFKKKEKPKKEECIEYGIKMFKKVLALRIKMEKSILKDMKSLYKVDDFFNNEAKSIKKATRNMESRLNNL